MADDAKVLDYLKRATADLRETRRRLAESEDKRHEPIAVVGMSCQYPGGVQSPEDLWRLVTEGRDGIGSFPTDRGWAEDALRDTEGSGSLSVQEGGFLDGAGDFDAGFFGISPREALAMDPQQRLLLEHAWTAVERAGIDPASLRGTRTGVFSGVMYHDYAVRLQSAADDVAGYVGTGSAASVVSGRVAYTMGLQGPTLTVDTACSSSLVALHLAASALRQDECRFALAGGVTVMSNAGSFVEFSRAGGLSGDGRCKSFAEGADGTGFGEGVGVLLLEKLSDARRAGHRVLAVLRGSSVNSDGASSGLTAPNGASQQRVIRQALANARLEPSDVDMIEAHGTGTPLGDPIEAGAVIATYGQDRDRPVYLGSIKSNIGHTQAAAGVSGVIKAIMAVRNAAMPRSLHLETPTSQVDWDGGEVSLLTETRDWPEVDRPRRAAVSSFGISGTNAHVVVEQAPDDQADDAADGADAATDGGDGGDEEDSPAAAYDGPTVWPLAARNEDALRVQADRLRGAVAANPEWTPVDVGHSLATTRTAFEHRAVVVGSTRDELLAGLDAVTPTTATRGRTAFAFTGQGSQRVGMGRDLAAAFPVFAEAWDEIVALLPEPVQQVLTEDQSRLDETEFAQPAIFAFEIALVRLFESWGVRPDVVIGHSVGEIAAAHVAGVLTLADAAALVVERARLMGSVTARGAMAVVGLPEDEITLPNGVEIAAVNAVDSTVVSGDEDAVLALVEECTARGVRATRLTVSHAFHSAHMDEAVQPLAAFVAELPRSAPLVDFVTVAGPGGPHDADYWLHNLRDTVRFAEGAARLDAARVVEIGPDAALTPVLEGCAPSQHRDRDEVHTVLRALAHVHATGGDVDWTSLHRGGRIVDLPTYPFQRTRYWPAVEAPTGTPWHYRDHWTPIAENPPASLDGWLVVGDPSTPLIDGVVERGARAVSDDELPSSITTGTAGVLALRPTVGGLLTLLQSLVDNPVPVWAVTTGAQDTATGAVPPELHDPEQAAVWGLGRTAALEIPERWGGLVDLRADVPAELHAERVARVLGGGETEVVVGPDGNHARRLTRAETAESWTPRGTVLITGGTGALGVRVAHWAAATADRIVLTSRRGGEVPEGLPGDTRVVAVDASDRDAMASLVAECEPNAVIHAAGVLDDGVLDRLTPERLATVAAAKPVALRVLDEVTRGFDLDAFVVFSSAAATFGAPGQANYAAANAELDALVRARHAAGLPGTAVAWGPWADDGMATGDKAAARTARAGLTGLTADRATTALALAVGSGLPVVTVADIDWSVFSLPGRLLEDLAPARPAVTAPQADPADRFRSLPADRRSRELLDLVREQAAAVLGFDSARAVPADQAFRDLGFDSLTAVELRTAVNAATGLSLPATAVFDHPSAADLARHLDELLDGADGTRVPSVVAATGSDEPVAIVGMACRFPGGVNSPDELWDMLLAERDGLGPFPDDRNWDLAALYDPDPDNPGTSYTETGGFLHDLPGFDADFFGISPREALAMDPQQRLLLETSWEAFERAGIPATGLRGSETGVFVGTNGQDYAQLFSGSTEGVEGHLATGNSASVVSGRLSYVFGLEGPAVTVDTACSASLVSLHLAVQALRSGECSLALAGGVTVMSTPTAFVEFSRQRGLAADGRCKSFAESADGTGWGEGVGVLVVERLSDARRRGRRVLGVVRGSAVNQDGASNGLTAPNGPSQERVIRQALVNAGLSGSDVDVVEAHGTGTSLGDPIEAQALLSTYGQGRERPLLLGSVKSNLGHTQAAAGVAGIIKVVEAMRRGVVPRTLHVDRPTSHVDWSSGSVELLTEAREWPEVGRPGRAAVSSFGVSGTNAHVILEQGDVGIPVPDGDGESPHETERAAESVVAVPFVLSARSPEALRAQADRLAAALPQLSTPDVAFSLATTRASFDRRAALVGGRDTLVDGLRALATGAPHPAVVTGTADDPGRLVFVFPGQGSQWVGMALRLRDESPVFAERLAECEAALDGFVDWSLSDALADAELLERVDVVQPVLWAVMVSLAEVWRSWGVEPAAVVGHSQGEIAAAVVAGVLSLGDGARVVALRSRALRRLAGQGGMVSVALGVDEVRERVAPFGARLSVAVVNGPSAVVVSGEPEALDELIASCEADDVRAKRVPVDYASHSSQVDDLREELLDVLAPVTPRAGEVPVYSTVTGRVEDGSAMGAEYWFDNLRNPVEFADAVEQLRADGFGTFVECSPHPVLTMALPDDVVAVGSLRRDEGGLDRLLLSLGEAVVAGVEPDWNAVVPGGHRVDLPTYPFQHERFWPRRVTAPAGSPAGFGQGAAGHPFLGALVSLADGDGAVLTGRISLDEHPWLADHVVAGRLVVPGTALVELALCAGDHTAAPHIEELTLQRPLILPEQGALSLQVSVGPDHDGRRSVAVHSRPDADDAPWTRHADGRLTTVAPETPAHDGVPPEVAEEIAVDGLYAQLASHDLGYGPAFQGLRRAWRDGDDVLAEVRLDDTDHVTAERFGLHPAVLDAALHAIALGEFVTEATRGGLPFSFTDVRLSATGATALRVRISAAGPDTVTVTATDPEGTPVVRIGGLAVRPLDAAALAPATGAALYAVDHTPVDHRTFDTGVLAETPDATGAPRILDVDDQPTAEILAAVQDHLADEGSGLLVVRTRSTVAGAAARGLVRTAANENPGRLALIDTDGTLDAVVVADDEPELVVRGGRVLAPRLVRAEAAPVVEPFGGGSRVLVTGGTGRLGAVVARHLVVAHGVGEVVLAGRRGGDAPGVEALVGELSALGASARVVACDVADRGAVAALLAEFPVTAVVHAAGTLDDGLVTDLDADRLNALSAPKLDAARNLAELAGDLDAFVLFSSAAGVFGNPGQAGYAAANTALDAFAVELRAQGVPATSLPWGLWAGASDMTGHLDETQLRRTARGGVRALTDADALALLSAAVRTDAPVLLPLDLDLAAVRAAGEVPPLLRSLVPAPRKKAATPDTPTSELGPAAAVELVRATTAAVLGHDGASAVDPERAFADLGFDSLTAVELRNRLATATGLRLPATLVFDHPTPQALAAHIAGDAPARRTGTVTRPVDEPIAIVSMGCRYPGGIASPDDLWDLVAGNRDAVGPFPADRGWDLAALTGGRPDIHAGGFLAEAADFDAGLFGISPREALAMDPQQRQLLEVSWETFERAGMDPHGLRGSRTGVFAGVMYQDYASRLGSVPDGVEGHLGTGNSASVVSGRVSYTFGLEGPAVTVDTACSSSLVAVHLAAQALRTGECDLGLAGGVTIMSTPGVFVEFTRQQGLSADGRCRSFADGADGTGFSEGVGLVLLERLSDARRNGHPVLALLRGSAVNQDGASNGLTAPNGPSQERVITTALESARLRPADVDLVEAHGTGTVLGDPIEAQALMATYGRDRHVPLQLGSVKSNLGHTQAAAGVAGIIKSVQAMRHGVVPASLHVDAPSTRIDWSGGAVELLTANRDWPAVDRPRRAGVSSFGISGTNAHVVLEQAGADPDASAPSPQPDDGPHAWVLSAHDETALAQQARRLAAHLTDEPAADVARTLAATRARLPQRAVVVGDRDRLLHGLAAFDGPGVVRGTAARGRTAFVFTGQGAQHAGMGRELAAAYPVFARTWEAVLALFPEHVRDELTGGGERIGETEFAQPALLAFEVALAGLLESWGVTPDVVIGHSVGEIAAAHVAGILTLEDAAELVVRRGALMASVRDRGAMAAIDSPAADVDLPEGVEIAAVNGPRSTVVSGDEDAVLAVLAAAKERGVRATRLDVSHAFHSAHMDEVLPEFRAFLDTVTLSAPVVEFVGVAGDSEARNPESVEYWVANIRETVRFADGVSRLDAAHVLEVGPDAALAPLVEGCVPAQRTDRDERTGLLEGLATLHVGGRDVDWARLTPHARLVDLPTYAFQHTRYWLDAEPVPVEPWLHRVEWDTITLGEPTTEPVAVLGEAPCDHRRIDSLDELADETLLLVDPDPALITEAVGRATRTWVVSSDAAVLAVARVAALEHPDRVGGTITVTDPAGWADVPRVLAGTEDQVRLGGRAAARRIVPATPTRSWRPRGTVLITGGSGALGTEAARWVAAEGADEVVLVSRSGADDAVLADLRATAGTTRIVSVAADVTDRDAMTAVVADHAPDAVVHTAGVSHVAPLTGTIPEDYARVAAAKVAGARILHDVTADLDAFVVYSSIAGVWGSGEQAAYAAANAALEDLVAERRAAGLPATAIAWGPWAGDGMAGGDTGADLTRRGLRPMEPRRAVEALSRTGEPLLVVADVDWARFTDTFTATRPSPLLARVTPETGDAATADDSALRTELAGLADAEVRRRLTDLVRTSAAAVLGHASTEPVPVATAFRDLGFDSLTAVELRDRIAAATGLTLPATLVFDHPSCGELAEHLRVTLLGGAERGRVRRAEAADEPIAVVGMACRFPGGADSPEALWQLLADGRDAVRPFPEDRGWDTSALFDADPDHHGTSYATEGGFLDGVADFDAAFFGISPREALSADPQQRLLLETSWEALERAGIDAHTLRGSATGVFVGTNSQDYATLLGHSTEAVEGYVATGNAASVISGRISYAFGLEGPAATVDTACSSSLVALHWAAQALRSGECDLALAGGATVMSTPGAFVEFSRQRGLAADGRCKPFAAAADGTGWGEGVGVLLVERLSDARANGHPVLAVVRGSAVNQDGASNGLTAPNGPAQQRVIGQALATAGLEPSDVDVVEAHGTGTALGDPIEAQAVLATYGRDRSNPLLLGSVKSNLGHTQAAAGVAGVIKTIEALRRAEVPASLHVDEPSTHVDWTVGAVELATRHTPWPETGRPRRAAVSSFGISGTNAHVVLEQGEPTPAPEVTREIPFVLSARSEAALRARAADLADVLRTAPGLARTRIAQALATTRTHFEHRATWPLDVDADVLAEGPLVTGDATTAGRLAFLFPGQGSQRPGSGAQLYAADPVFAAAFDEACAHLDEHLDRPLREVAHTGDAELLGETAWTQPVLFAQQVALHRLAEFHGVVPDLLLGHSIGEVAAAHVAGVLDLADAAALVAARASLMQSVTTPGAMASVAAGEDEVRAVLPEGADIAAVNGPHATVVSGDCEAVAAVVEYFTTAGTKVRELRVSHAFHSAHLDPVLDRFRDVLTGLTFHEPRIPVVSDVTGAVATELTDPEYWVRQAREAVRFHDGLVCLREAGVTAALELGADGGLSSLAAAELSAAVPLLRDGQPGRGEPDAVTAALAALYVAGFDVDWTVLGPAPRDVVLPTYPFQRERFWPRSFAAGTGDAGAAGLGSAGHPLLGASVPVAGSDLRVFTARLSTRTHPWLADHRIGGDVLLPGTAYVDLAAHVGDEVGCPHVAEVTLAAPLVLPADGAAVDLQVNAGAPDERGTRTLAVHSRPAGDPDAAWTAHAEGVLSPELPGVPAPAGEWPPPGAEPVDLDGFYARLADAGFDYGPVFRALRGAWRSDGAVHAEVSLLSGPDGRGADAAQHRAGTDAAEHGLHPALLDAALQAAALDGGDGGVPFAFTGVALHATGADALRVTLRRSPTGAVSLRADDPAGAPVVTVDGLALRAPVAAETPTDAALLHLTWTPAAASDTDPAGTARPGAALRWAVLGTPPAAEVPPAVVADDLDDLAAAGSEGVLDYVVAPVTGHVDAHAATHAALDLVQRWLADDRFADARLVVLTVGASLDAPDVGHLPGTAVHGLVRSAQSENPDRLVLLDLDRADAELPAAALHLAATEPQLAVRDGVPHAARLVRAPEAPPAGGTWRLAAGADRTVDAVRALPGTADRALAEDEVRLAMRAAGVNFRDVLIALGMYPGDVPMGSEGAGVVLETGPGVTTLRPGQRVFGLVPEAFGPTAIADARMLAEVPDDWSFEDAAAVPLVFLTAYYALRDLADLREGESVLIHSAAGGVGMAAVQLARHWGAEVYGTASPSKWDAVRELGVDHLDSSRDLGFADRFGPVDVVLNSLAGEFIDASLGLLADGGRFLEMGKTDLRDPDGVHYRSFDLIEAGPERIGEMLTELVGLFAEGALRHLPRRHWDVREAAAAFRFVSQARHVGKVVLTVPRPRDPEGTVLVTGATGALGARVVRHLGEGGARHLLLASRSGPASPRAAELADLGAHVVACDLADRDDVAALLASIPDEHPLTAVVHVAGVLDDGVVGALNPDRVDRVFAPKVEAVTILHELTSHADLAEFTVFSSAAGVFGGAGQANYAAANAYLDALARHRRGLGLPATALAWGLWDESESMAAELGSADRGRLSRAGVGALSTTDALRLLDAAVEAPTSAVVPMHLDLAALRSAPEAAPRLLRDLVGPARTSRRRAGRAGDTAAPGAAQGLAERLAGRPADEADRTLLDLVRTHVAGVLGHGSPEAVDPRRAFKDIGFDSLTAVELRNRLTGETGLRLSATLIFDHPTPQELVEHLRGELLGSADAAPAVPARSDTDEPLAIVGLACRFPGGADTPEQLWAMLAEGRDGIGPFPVDRGWQMDALYDPTLQRPGTTHVREGGFIHGAGEFDAAFFGISPREALAMDPQQRLLLQTTWEALERAGIDPQALRGTDAGVFVGAATANYGAGLPALPDGVEGHLLTGTATSVASGRVSYTLGLEGPAVTVDTACSSSLVSLHLAAAALRSGECSLALAGGATVMAVPGAFTEFSRQGGLAPDGRCKPFAESADGTGWSEGVGMLVVERLSEAERRGHRVLAVLRGSAVNQDGASNGLTAPNGPSQQRVIRSALTTAGLRPSDVDAVEAHGTGTPLGDPIEAQALLATYGHERDRPLLLGSVKSNLGHTQAAAGVAGVIKMVMALRHRMIPQTLHVDRPSTRVDWAEGDMRLVTEPVDLSAEDRTLRAAVSSFGISGTNAHVVLEEGPAPAAAAPDHEPAASTVPWVLSARTTPVLRDQAARLLASVGDAQAADVAWSLSTTRASFDRRAALVGDRDTLVDGLRALATGGTHPSLVEGSAGEPGRLVLVFPGQGSQWVGMARDLAAESAVFAGRLAECEAALDGFVEWSLSDVLADVELLERVDVVQPALWAVMVSLAEVWRSWGVEPAAVVGHSQGEIAAAVVAGVLSLEDGARVVALRSRALRRLAGGGGMVSVALGVGEVRERVAPFGARLSVAVVNGPSAVVVSGEPEALDELIASCEADDVRAKRVPVDYASHSSQVDDLREELLDVLAPVTPRAGEVPVYSTVTGRVEDGSAMGAEYWFDNLRNPVEFADAVERLRADGFGTFVECSPHPVLTMALPDDVVAVGSLRRDEGGLDRLLLSLGEAAVAGVTPDWDAVIPGGRRVDLPTYPFQQKHYWLVPPEGHRPERTVDDVESRFWDTVEREDLDDLAGVLDLDPAAPLSDVVPALSAWRRRGRTRSTVDAWRYRVDWRPVPDTAPAVLTGTWALLVPDGVGDHPLADATRQALMRRGADVDVVVVPAAADRAALAAQLPSDAEGVLSLLALAEDTYPGQTSARRGAVQNLQLLQALGDAGLTARLWCVTSHAVDVRSPVSAPLQAMVWGMGRVAALEHPERWGGLVDLPADVDDRAGDRLAAVVSGALGEDQVAVRDVGVLGRRLVQAPPSREPEGWQPRGTALVTGGTGALGSAVATWLAERGAPHVLLVSRRGEHAPGAPRLRERLTALGTRVTFAACDAGDRDQLAAVLDTVPEELPLDTVVHTAAVLDDGVLDALDADRVDRACRPKVDTALHLHELTRELPLSAFVLFSSFAGTFGTPGQGNYAPGNAYLDALAAHRRDLGLPATSIAWGPWGGAGMADGAVGELARRHGVPEMEPELALEALHRAVDAGDVFTAVADIDWNRFGTAFTATRPSRFLSEMPQLRANGTSEPDEDDLPTRLAGMPEAERERAVLDVVRAQAAAVLGHTEADEVDEDRAFRELGFDSVTAVELRNRLRTATGLALPAALVFDHPSPQALAEYLLGDLFGDAAAASPLDEVDRLAAALVDPGEADATTRTRVAQRLQALLAQWRDGEPEKTEDAEDFDSATSADMFDFIDRELGLS